MITGYNYSTVILEEKKSNNVVIKGSNIAVKTYDLTDGKVEINTDGWATGQYAVQFFHDNDIIKTDVLQINQNLKYVDENFDPTSPAKKTLDAINAFLAGIATHQQRRVQIGDKSIEYSTYDELMKWKNYYEQQVRKQQGKACNLRHQKLYYKGI